MRKYIFKEYSGLPKGIYYIFIARIITAIGTFVYPFLTLFLTDKMQMSKAKVGLYFTILAAAYIPGALIGGKLADSFGRKKVMIIFQALAAVSFIPCAFLGESMIVVYLIIIASFFNAAAQPASNAMMNDLSTKENRRAVFSLFYLGNNIGIAIGPLIAGFLYNNYLMWIFLGDAITTLASLIIFIVYVPETLPSKEHINKSFEIKDGEKGEKGSLLKVFFAKPSLIAFSVALILYSFVYAQNPYVIPMQAREVFGINGPKVFGAVMTTNALVVVFMTTALTRITKKNSNLLNVAIAGAFYGIGFGMLYFARSFFTFIITAIIWSMGEVLANTNSSVYFANHTPTTHRGRFNSIIPMITGSGYAIGPAIMGYYLKALPAKMAWPLVSILSLIGALMMLVLLYFEKRPSINR